MSDYGRFYVAFRGLEVADCVDRDELKRSIVLQYTDGRTDSLKRMTREEYIRCCRELEAMVTDIAARRKKRSEVLKLMQELGIDTRDWDRINAFCRDQRIAGMPFAALDEADLTALSRKLRAIIRKGGIKEPELPARRVEIIDMSNYRRHGNDRYSGYQA